MGVKCVVVGRGYGISNAAVDTCGLHIVLGNQLRSTALVCAIDYVGDPGVPFGEEFKCLLSALEPAVHKDEASR